MGFFGKLFEKKECSVCGGEIGLLGESDNFSPDFLHKDVF